MRINESNADKLFQKSKVIYSQTNLTAILVLKWESAERERGLQITLKEHLHPQKPGLLFNSSGLPITCLGEVPRAGGASF